MSASISTAVIMAAGMGTRLKDIGTQMPKGFLQLGERPIIEESIESLRQSGITSIVIVTGHLDQFYENLKEKYSGLIHTVHNDKYSDSGSMYSLYLARDKISADFLLLESDLIFERRALSETIAFNRDNVILLSGTTHSGDEVYVTRNGNCIAEMSKNKNDLNEPVAGELVGISKISLPLYHNMVDYSEQRFKTTLHVDYETDCLVDVAKRYPVYFHVIEDLLWSEIDDASHLDRARQKIYPAILAKDH